MAKEPKLLAEIRANQTRVGKAAAKSARGGDAQPTAGPQFLAAVETPDVPNAPSNYIARAFEECTTLDQLRTLLAHAKQHRYSEDGQTVQLIEKRIAELGHRELIGAQKATPGKRGAR